MPNYCFKKNNDNLLCLSYNYNNFYQSALVCVAGDIIAIINSTLK